MTAGGPGSFRGITWDHPRGRNALVAAAEAARTSGSVRIAWSAHSLEHFESHPVDDLGRRYDLIVLDHPHLGEALATGALQPLDDVVDGALLASWSTAAVGPSFSSYRVEGRQWALPLDAATQVAVRRPTLLGEAPDTWDDVDRLSAHAPVALSLAGPHAFLTFASLCVGLGRPVGGTGPLGAPGPDDEHLLVDPVTGARALDLLRTIGARAPRGSAEQNPISLLERMATTDEVAYCPLVYGYVTYSGPLRFEDAPTGLPGGRRGSTIGGTGLALSARAEVTPELVAHLAWLMSSKAQEVFVPHHDGQPARRSAWTDAALDHTSHGFYRGTLATIEDSWVRPRYPGYIGFQSAASQLIREVVAGGLGIDAGLARLGRTFATSAASATTTVVERV